MQFPGQCREFNPYLTGFAPIYVTWDGQEYRNQKPGNELSVNEVYRVANTYVQSSSSSYSLVEMGSGKQLDGTFNTIHFRALPTCIACCAKRPQIGECVQLSVIRIDANNIEIHPIISSPILFIDGVDHFSGTCVAVTVDTVYYLQLPH